MTDRDTLTSPETISKDRNVGKLLRELAYLVGIAVAVIVGYSKVADLMQDEVERHRYVTEDQLTIAQKDVAAELRSIREARQADSAQLADFLQRLDARMDALEKRR